MKPDLIREFRAFVDAVRADAGELTLGPEAQPTEGVLKLGSPEGPQTAVLIAQRESLCASIARAISWQRKLLCVPIVMSVLLHMVAIAVFLRYSLEPKFVAALFAATGISLTLPLRWLVSIARELWEVELIAATIPLASDEQLALILEVLLSARLGDRQSPGAAG
jgi:hypothetical protein